MRKSSIFILAMLLTTPFLGCRTAKVEYVEKPVVPEIAFPVFPVLSGAVRNREERTVSVPEEWIVRLEEYRIRIEETEKNYNEIKKIYENETEKEE